MTTPEIALAISVISLGIQGVLGFVQLRTRVELASLVERLDDRYPSQKVFDLEIKRLEQRIGDFSELRQARSAGK